MSVPSNTPEEPSETGLYADLTASHPKPGPERGEEGASGAQAGVQRRELSCSLAHLRRAHPAHDWEPQPGVAPVHCPGDDRYADAERVKRYAAAFEGLIRLLSDPGPTLTRPAGGVTMQDLARTAIRMSDAEQREAVSEAGKYQFLWRATAERADSLAAENARLRRELDRLREKPAPADSTQVDRWHRREQLPVLLSRMQRGVLLDTERGLLRAAVETEIADAEQAHAQLAQQRADFAALSDEAARLGRLLDEARADHREERAARRWHEDDNARLRDERDRARDIAVELEQQLAAVADLHQPVDGIGWHEGGVTYGEMTACSACGVHEEYGAPWPCPTARALNGEAP